MDDERSSVPDKIKHNLPGSTAMLSVDYNVASLLCYCPLMPINIIASILWLATEPKENKLVRFHATQSLIMLCGLIAANFAFMLLSFLKIIPFIGGIISMGLGLLGFVVWGGYFLVSIMLMAKAHSREMYKLPYLGDLADRYSA